MTTPARQATHRRRLILRVSTRRDVEMGLPISLEIAAALRSELATLFVSDEAPFAASALPFPTMVGFSGGTLTLDPGRLETAVRREAESCRQLLSRAAEGARLAWSFQTLRGETVRLLREASSLEDILVIGLDRLTSSLADLIPLARELAPSHGGVLFVRERSVRGRGPLVLVARPDDAVAALAEFASALADALGSRVAQLSGPLEASAPLLATARLVLAPIESALLDDAAALRRIAGTLPAMLLMRTKPAE
jgi:hypothetical protein